MRNKKVLFSIIVIAILLLIGFSGFVWWNKSSHKSIITSETTKPKEYTKKKPTPEEYAKLMKEDATRVANADIKRQGITITEVEKDFLVNYYTGKTDADLYTFVANSWSILKTILSEKWKNTNLTTEKASFLYLCNVYISKWLEELKREFINMTFPQEDIPVLDKEWSIGFFKKTCQTENPWSLKWLEDAGNTGCLPKPLFYYNLNGKLSNDNLYSLLYSDDTAKKLIKDQSEIYFYNFMKDFLQSKKITVESCIGYIQ